MRVYAQHGVAHYWLLDPETRELEEYVLVAGEARYVLRTRTQGDAVFRSAVLPELAIELGEVWA